MHCNICGSTQFVDMHTRKNARCAQCGSLERTRLLWLYFQTIPLPDKARILHLAPERGIHDEIRKMDGVAGYICADFDPSRYRFTDCVKLDLCQMDDLPSFEYDMIIHSHVLEHTPCNIAYTLFHLHRMLKPDGVHLCVIPFSKGGYDECFEDIGNEERTRRFGQFDHVRRFGTHDIASHLGKLLKLPASFDATTRFAPETLLEANIPEAHWRGFHISTVLQLRRSDMSLIAGGGEPRSTADTGVRPDLGSAPLPQECQGEALRNFSTLSCPDYNPLGDRPGQGEPNAHPSTTLEST